MSNITRVSETVCSSSFERMIIKCKQIVLYKGVKLGKSLTAHGVANLNFDHNDCLTIVFYVDFTKETANAR